MGSSFDTPLAAELLPLSLSQQEVWLDQRAWPGSTHLNIGGAGYIEGPFDLALFQEALVRMVAENEALRLVPLLEGGQRLLAVYDASLKLVDLSAANEPKAAMRTWWQAWIADPFAFDGTPPWRFALLRYSDTLHGLTIQFHHLIMDGWGTSQVMQRWAAIYNALASGDAPPVSTDPGYRQFVGESVDYRNSHAFEKDAAFWRERVPVLPPTLIERRYPQATAGSLPQAHVLAERLSRSDYDRLGQLAGQFGASLFGYLIAVIAAYFSRTCRRSEVVIGLPILNRSGKRYRETFGMFVGVFPLVVNVLPGMTVEELIKVVSASLKAAVRHQRYPVSELARYLGTIRQRRDSIFDVLFSFERQDYDLNFGAGHLFGSRQIFSGLARYPLGITLCEFQSVEDVELTLEASPLCFSADEAGYLARRLTRLTRIMAEAPECPVEDLALVPPEELRVLLPVPGADNPPVPYFRQFEHWVARTPMANALVWDGGQIDYATLNSWADHLAGNLQLRGVGRGSLVALIMARSPEQVAAMLAISKVGAAFLPLDPDAPLERLRHILDGSHAGAVMLQLDQEVRLAGLHPAMLSVLPTPVLNETPLQAAFVMPSDLAYVLFTSGSTGQPKGAMLEHEALSRRLAWISRTYNVVPTDRTGQCTQYTFDPSLIELLLPLVNGASLALPPPGRMPPSSLGPFAIRHQVTIMALVPLTLRGLLDSIDDRGALRLRVACCGGEVLPPELSNRFIRETGGRLFNVYGPTEAAIFATAWETTIQPLDASLPVGRAIDGTRIYILDEHRHLLPFGVPGEIYIGGRCVARGYLNQPQLDQNCFFADPQCPGERIYRTGDHGWLATDGNLHFVGRSDRQIKLRGYRIELGEIEATLMSCQGVEQAAAKLLHHDGKGAIHVWVAGAQPGNAAGNIRRHLESRLPDYMQPRGISCLSVLPTSPTGKIDYEALPEPEFQTLQKVSRLPENAMERALLALWQAVLKREDLTVTDNLFDLGGDSLAAIDILTGIETLIGRPVPLFLLIEHPSIEQLVPVLEAQSQRHTPGAAMLHLRRGRVPLYFAASGHGDLIRFKNLANALGDSCDFFMLQPPTGRVVASISDLAECYAEQIINDGRPGVLAGFSVGGITSLETARTLRSKGFPVSRLILVDAIYPGHLMRSAIFWRSMGWLARQLNASELSLNGRHLGALFSDRGLIAQINAMSDYQPACFDGKVCLIKSSGMLRWDRWVFKPWRKLLGKGLQERQVQGLHGSIFEIANIDELAAALASCIDGVVEGGA